jgi:hypothetical protein
MGLLDRLLHGGRGEDQQERRRIEDTTARIVALSPHLLMARRGRARVRPSVSSALRFFDGLVATLPPARQASADAWAEDPYIHAFFAAPGDIAPALSRSLDLRTFFERNPQAQEAYGVLGMAIAEKHILGTALEGDILRRDVIQQTISFGDYQVRVCGRTEAELREEIVRRLVEQLGLEGLAQVAADESRREMLEQERALLKTRLQLLKRQGVGMRGVLGDEEYPGTEELARVRQEIQDNERASERLGIRSEAIERTVEQVCATLSDPASYISVESRPMRLSKTNVVLAANSFDAGDEITVQVARVPGGQPRVRAFALVRFARAALLPQTSLFERAARLLH